MLNAREWPSPRGPPAADEGEREEGLGEEGVGVTGREGAGGNVVDGRSASSAPGTASVDAPGAYACGARSDLARLCAGVCVELVALLGGGACRSDAACGGGWMNAYETLGDEDHPLRVRSESPQSLVTSHQNEYIELTRTAASLRARLTHVSCM